MDFVRHRPLGAARLIGDIGDISRFPTRDHFASWNGTAPIDASTGENDRQRLSRSGNRRMNRVLHLMADVQLRHDTEGRAYYGRKKPPGKTSMEALRALKRRLSDHRLPPARHRRPKRPTTEEPRGSGPGRTSGGDY